jgi:hypothetical protein
MKRALVVARTGPGRKVAPLIDGTKEWSVAFHFDVPAQATDPDSIGGVLVNMQGDLVWACTILFENGT